MGRIVSLLLILIWCCFGINVSAQIKAVKGDTVIWIDTVLYSAPPYKVKQTLQVKAWVKQLKDRDNFGPGSGMIVNGKVLDTVEYHATPYIIHGTQASYPGGENSFIRFIKTHMRLTGNLKVIDSDTPKQAAKLWINFQIESNGTISDVRFSGDHDIDHLTEVDIVRAIKMAVWKPAIDNGKPVAGGHTMPVVLVNK